MSTASLAAHRHPARNRWQPTQRKLTIWRHKTRAAAKRIPAHIIGPRATVRSLLLTAVALGFLDAAAYTAGLIIGLTATGLSVLLFNECMN